MSFIDRNLLQFNIEADLKNVLEARSAYGPIPPWLSMKVDEQVRNLNRKANDGVVPKDHILEAHAKLHQIQDELATLSFDDNRLIEPVKHLMSKWLPPLETVWEDIWSFCKFGPGSIFHAKRPHEKSLLYKIGGRQTVTPKAYYLSVSVIGKYYPRFAEQIRDVTITRGNRLAGVPKDADRCRLVAIEPSLNVFLQLGVGMYLVDHMRKHGISDLRKNQQLHRCLVADYETWGTIDLRDASDRISKKLMKLILPSDWYELLDALRSHQYFDGEKWHDYEGFSSQGNAFTFPLETLVFKAVAMAASERKVFVYGDDIIAPVESCPLVASALESFGFVVNTQKSFWGQHDGILADFRESCGEDTCRGHSVRSVYYKNEAKSDSDVAALMNMLYEKWGYLPATHGYLSTCFSKPAFVGPMEYYSASDSGGWNIKSKEYSSWLWLEIALELGMKVPIPKYSKAIQAMVVRLKYWSRKTIDLPPRLRLGDEVQWLSFLYSGAAFVSTEDRPVVRVKTITDFPLLS